MTSSTVESPEQRRRRLIRNIGIGLLVVLAIAAVAIPSIPLLTDRDRLTAFIDDAGPWGPVVFVLIQIVQVFVAPIPGQVTGFAGGFLFGPVMGAVYATIGGTIGCALVFILARRFGRPFAERFVSEKVLRRFDYISERRGALILLIIFLVPIFPDDLICYVAGLSRIPIPRLILVALVGRIPGYVVFSLTGAGVADSNLNLLLIVAGLSLLALSVAFWQRKHIERFLRGLASKRGKQPPARLDS